MEQVGRDDEARASFASLAVDGDDVRWVPSQVGMNALAHHGQELQWARIVIVPRVMLDQWKEFGTHLTLTHQVVDLVVLPVVLLQQAYYLRGRVAIEGLHEAGGGTAHRDDPGRDVGQIEVKSVLLEAHLLA